MAISKTSLGWLTALLLLLFTGSTLAQERLFIMRTGGELSELETTDTSFGTVRGATQLPAGTRVIRLAGGRYLLLYAGYPLPQTTLAVFDTRTSTTTVLPYSLPGPVVFEPDEFRPRLFYRTQEAIGVIRPPTFAPRELFATKTELFGFESYALHQYVEATNSVLLARQVTLLQVEIVAIDADTGAVRGVIPADGVPEALLVDNVGRRLYVPARQPLSLETEIRVYDLDTLELLAKSRSYKLPLEVTWRFDVMRQQILVGVHNGQQGTGRGPWALSLDEDLKPGARVDFSDLEFDQQLVHKFELMPSTARERTFAVLARSAIAPSTLGQWTPGQGVLVALEADRLKPAANADLHVTGESFDTSIIDAILLTPPPPPTPLEFTIAGQQVDLQWRDPGDATHFMVEVGTGSGRSDLGILQVGKTTTWGVDGVPAGTYYVRVRAGNDVGPSLPSNEVVVTVP
jgi:hypothetical protein